MVVWIVMNARANRMMGEWFSVWVVIWEFMVETWRNRLWVFYHTFLFLGSETAIEIKCPTLLTFIVSSFTVNLELSSLIFTDQGLALALYRFDLQSCYARNSGVCCVVFLPWFATPPQSHTNNNNVVMNQFNIYMPVNKNDCHTFCTPPIGLVTKNLLFGFLVCEFL